MTLTAINPATGETMQEYTELSPQAADERIAQAHQAFLSWRRTSFAERSVLMKNAAQLLRERAPDYAHCMAQEMGKPLKEGEAEAEKCAWVCEYYAEHAEQFLQPELIETDATKSFCCLPAARSGAGRYAVEFPVLAGSALCRSRPYGWQRRGTQARLKRAGVRPGD